MGISEAYKVLKNEIPEDVTLVCVSKTRQIQEIKQVYAAGARDFGENKVQELMEKYDEIHKNDFNIHLLGHLQTNKVKYIIDKVNIIHSNK